jgi:hypothetical protein
MPEFTRLLPVFAVAGLLAACTATTPDAPPGESATSAAAATDAAAPATRRDGTGEYAAAAAPGPSAAQLAELDPAQRRRFELWRQTMQQIEPCLRPRLAEIAEVDQAGVVAVQVEYDDAGAPVSADLQEGAPQRMQDNETYRAVVNAILNSVRECAPLTDMPEEEFDTWRLFPVVVRPSAA